MNSLATKPIMKDRQRKTKDPCLTCFLHKDICICSSIPKLDLMTRLILVIHAKELKRTTNTGRLALHALTNSQMFIRGEGTTPLDLSHLLTDEYQTLLFFPSDGAIELTTNYVQNLKQKANRPVQLIVPDGNWRQASKVHHRHQELAHIPRVMIKEANLSLHRLRTETTPEGMATLEAIAKAFDIIEGPSSGQALMDLYQAKLRATLVGRGVKA